MEARSSKSRGLNGMETELVDQALDALRDAGFAVDRIQDVERVDHGVTFDLTVYSASRTMPMDGGEDQDDGSNAG